MNFETEDIVIGVLKVINFIVNTPYVAILFSIPVFFLGLKLFKRGITVKNSEDYSSIRALGTSIGLFILSVMLIINAILLLKH